MAYLVEQAGGAASAGRQRIMDLQSTQIHERSPVFIRSKEDVASAEYFIRKLEHDKDNSTAKK